jgi:hypothetical protein
MRRVLVSGGRLALNTWRPRQYSPGFAAMAEALAHYITPGLLDAPYSLSDGEELRALVAGAGFHDVTIRAATRTIRFPSAEDFVQSYVAASPLAQRIAQLDDRTRTALVGDVSAALHAYVDSDGLAFPTESHLTIAQA